MSAEVKVLLIIVLVYIADIGLINAIKQGINLYVLIDSRKHPEKYQWQKGGLVYNKKTGKLESASNRVILPF